MPKKLSFNQENVKHIMKRNICPVRNGLHVKDPPTRQFTSKIHVATVLNLNQGKNEKFFHSSSLCTKASS
jgi:hypothetical protein